MTPDAAKLVTPGNLEDDLAALADVDWIVEAIVEEPSAKQALYQRLEPVRRPGSIVSSNTSTIPLAYLTREQPESFRRDFLITHFFNPPRYMRLLEVVAGPTTRPEALEAITRFADLRLGKGVVRAKDTPGFIANRIGTYWLQTAIDRAIELGLTVEEADAVLGTPVGIPKTGVFGLLDLVGIDLIPKVAASMDRLLPAGDRLRANRREQPLIARMIAEGSIGRKGKGGFYRLSQVNGARVKEAIDLRTGAYRTSVKARPESVAAARAGGLRALVSHPDRTGRYAWAVLSETLAYAAELVPAISDTVWGVDEAMRLGYNWQFGPFELIDQLGTGWFADRLAAEGRPVPELLRLARGGPFYRVQDGRLEQLGVDGSYLPVERPDGVLVLADVKRAGAPLLRNGSAALWDIGDGVACFEFTSKMNALDADTLELLAKIDRARGRTAPRHGGLQRGPELLGRRQSRPRPVRAQCRPVGPARGAGRQGPAGLPRAEVRAVPDRRAHRRAWRSAAAARSCCTAPPSRPMPRPIWGWSRPGSGSCPPGAAARRCCCGRWPTGVAPAGRCRRSARRSS